MFVAGELEIIKVCGDNEEKEGRIRFLKTLMYYCSTCELSDIHKWYVAWLREIQLGNKVWGDDFAKVSNDKLKQATFPDSQLLKANHK